MRILLVAALLAVALILSLPSPASHVVELPAGIVEVHHEIVVTEGTDLHGAASGTKLRAASDFVGRALIVVRGAHVTLRGFTIDGNREELEQRRELPPSNRAFFEYTRGNGVLAVGVSKLRIENMHFRNVAGFAILVGRANEVRIDQVDIADCGSHNTRGRNNTTGGILIEEGTREFRVTRSSFKNIYGNGVWTHSLFTSPRNSGGWIAFNYFDGIGRDAIQVGHATAVKVEDNEGTRIGYPEELVDLENEGYPVAIDTAGDVDHTVYLHNRFMEVDGKCIDLDGFHDGEVIENSCLNRPDAALYPYGNVGILFNDSNPNTRSNRIRVVGNVLDGVKYSGILTFGSGHTIAHNRLLNLNLAHCNEETKFGCYYPKEEPEMLESGIYLGRGFLWKEPARDNVVEDNEISGYQMKERCVGFAPGVQAAENTIRNNRCDN